MDIATLQVDLTKEAAHALKFFDCMSILLSLSLAEMNPTQSQFS